MRKPKTSKSQAGAWSGGQNLGSDHQVVGSIPTWGPCQREDRKARVRVPGTWPAVTCQSLIAQQWPVLAEVTLRYPLIKKK